MFRTKTLDGKLKKPNLSGYVRKKTYDYRNIINFDEDISELDINIKEIPTFKKKSFNFNGSKNVRAFNNIIKLKNINKLKLNHCNSITTTTSYREKSVKKVTFSTVEIIRVEKYKKYNANSNFSKNLIKKNMEEVKQQNDNNESTCSIF